MSALCVDLFVAITHFQPRSTLSEACVLRSIPLHWSTGVVSGLGAQNTDHFLLALTLKLQDIIIVQAFNIHILVNRGIAGICHTDLLSLINIRCSLQAVNGCGKTFCRFYTVFLFISDSGNNSRLIMVAPEQSIPAAALFHFFLPGKQMLFQIMEAERLDLPFISGRIIHFQVMEAEDHGQLVRFRVGIADAVFQCGRRHFAYSYHIVIFSKGILVQLLKILVDFWSVCIETVSVPFQIILINVRFGDQIDHVEAQSLYPLFQPEVYSIINILTHLRVFPVQICLGYMEQMKVILICFRKVAPCVSTEF